MSSPFDQDRFKRLLKGLDIKVLSLSEVSTENAKLRFDSAYFGKAVMRIDASVRTYGAGFVELGETAAVFKKGIFDIKAESYTESGIPFIRIGNLRRGVISERGMAYISADVHLTEEKTAVRRGDLAISKTGYAAASYVQLSEANVSQDIIAYRVKPTWQHKLKPGFLAAYLNSDAGLSLMQRQFQGNVQLHLSLGDGAKIPIPLIGSELQIAIESAFLRAFEEMKESERALADAKLTVLDELGLTSWSPPDPLSYQRKAKDVFLAERLDAEHFREQFVAMKSVLDEAGALEWIPLSDLALMLTNGHTPLRHDLTQGDVPFLCAEHVSDFELDYASEKKILEEHHAGELRRTAIRNGDVLLTIKGRVGNAAIAENVPGRVNINQDVALLRLNDRLPKWWVVTFLNCYLGKLTSKQFSTGAINPFLGLFSVRKMPIPRFPDDKMERIVARARIGVHTARVSRQKAEQLLDNATRAVQIALEDSEDAALGQLGDT